MEFLYFIIAFLIFSVIPSDFLTLKNIGIGLFITVVSLIVVVCI